MFWNWRRGSCRLGNLFRKSCPTYPTSLHKSSKCWDNGTTGSMVLRLIRTKKSKENFWPAPPNAVRWVVASLDMAWHSGYVQSKDARMFSLWDQERGHERLRTRAGM